MTTTMRLNEIENKRVGKEVAKMIRGLADKVKRVAEELPEEGQVAYGRVVDYLEEEYDDVRHKGIRIFSSYEDDMYKVASQLEPGDWWPKRAQNKCRNCHAEMHRLIGMARMYAIMVAEEKEDEIEY